MILLFLMVFTVSSKSVSKVKECVTYVLAPDRECYT